MIKELASKQTEEVMQIWLKSNLKAHPFIPSQYWLDNYDVVKNKYLPNSLTFVYEDAGIVKGFISVMNSAFIGALFVLPEYQGCGIGKRLLSYCMGLYADLELGVYVENVRAVSFYKSCGFIIQSEQLNDDSGFLEYIMKWTK